MVLLILNCLREIYLECLLCVLCRRELLRAMEARLSALHQEQNMVFTRASAAGFDSNNIADLMTFAHDFGAERLK